MSKSMQGLGSLYRLSKCYNLDLLAGSNGIPVLTGTPVHNNLIELWSLLHFLYPTVFTSTTQRIFADSFDLTRGLYSSSFTAAARNLLEKVMLRRTKASVELSVPPRDEMTIYS